MTTGPIPPSAGAATSGEGRESPALRLRRSSRRAGSASNAPPRSAGWRRFPKAGSASMTIRSSSGVVRRSLWCAASPTRSLAPAGRKKSPKARWPEGDQPGSHRGTSAAVWHHSHSFSGGAVSHPSGIGTSRRFSPLVVHSKQSHPCSNPGLTAGLPPEPSRRRSTLTLLSGPRYPGRALETLRR